MALCRCTLHQPADIWGYNNSVLPVGYPNTSSICGSGQCTTAGRIYLKDDEFQQFLNGVRIFKYATNVTKVKVMDTY